MVGKVAQVRHTLLTKPGGKRYAHAGGMQNPWVLPRGRNRIGPVERGHERRSHNDGNVPTRQLMRDPERLVASSEHGAHVRELVQEQKQRLDVALATGPEQHGHLARDRRNERLQQ